MKILVDAFGGDNAPVEIVKGAILAKKDLNCEISLVGNREKIFRKVGILDDIEIIDAECEISMTDDPMQVMKLLNSSMAVALKLVSEGEADGFVSAGNSGALTVGSTLIAKRIKGIKRCTFAPIIPSENGFFMLIDSGANVECRPEMLYQFGLMGSVYMESVLGIKNPRVGLVNNGVEPEKGDALRKAAYKLLAKSNLNFIGNIEARDIVSGNIDVVVADGFTGNVILKMYEGTVKMINSKFKQIFSSSTFTKIAASMLIPKIKIMKDSMNPNKYGGAPILGCCKPIFKAHGSSNAVAIKNAIRLTYDYINDDVINKITKSLSVRLSEDNLGGDKYGFSK